MQAIVNAALSQTAGRFLISGCGATAFHYLIMLTLIDRGWPAGATTAVGAGAGAVANYLAQRQFTFRSQSSHVSAGPRYAASVGACWLLNSLFFWVLHSGLSIDVYVSQVLATLLLAGCNYWVLKRYVFL